MDLSLPGVTVRPIRDLAGDAHFNEVFFDDVLLADDALIGEEGDGWAQVNAELAFERSGPERIYSSIVLLEHWIACLRRDGHAARDVETIGRLATHLATLRNMSVAVTTKLVAGESPVIEAALVKDIGTTFEQAIPTLLAKRRRQPIRPSLSMPTCCHRVLPCPGGAHLFAARRHPRDPARHDRARPRTALRKPHVR